MKDEFVGFRQIREEDQVHAWSELLDTPTLGGAAGEMSLMWGT